MSETKRQKAPTQNKGARRRKKKPPAALNQKPMVATLSESEVPVVSDDVTVTEAQLRPYDENLPERSRTQSQLGDWKSLTQVDRDTLQNHPDRAKLALMVADSHQQQGNLGAARHFTRLAKDWGCSKKLVRQVMIAGVHNTLGRAAAISGQETRALRNFEAAIVTGTSGGDVQVLLPARVSQQFAQIGLPMPANLQTTLATGLSSPLTRRLNITAQHHQRPFEIQQLAVHRLGEAWAANTINTVIFRHHGIFTSGQWQFSAFYPDKHTLRVVKRNLTADSIDTFDISGDYNLCDAHNSISLGMDRVGFLHVSYDHHGTRLRYCRSIAPHSIHGWTDELPMTGAHEETVSYPTFILPAQGQGQDASNTPLLLLYRDGNWKKGSARFKIYDEATQSWADRPTPILSGAEHKPWTSNAYWNHPVTGTDGSLHLSFVWRTDSIGEEQRINNINVCYARSLDNGLSWHTSHNRPYQLPITQVNAETVHPVSPGCNLINQTSMALDSKNRPHIVFYSDDPHGIPQYQHLRFDGKAWHHKFISERSEAFTLMGKDTLQIPISRPEVVIDRADSVYIIYRGDFTENRMAATRLSPPDYCFTPEHTSIIWDENLGYAEPIIDRRRWQRDNVLTMLVQHNRQPDGDRTHDVLNTPVSLIDVSLK